MLQLTFNSEAGKLFTGIYVVSAVLIIQDWLAVTSDPLLLPETPT